MSIQKTLTLLLLLAFSYAGLCQTPELIFPSTHYAGTVAITPNGKYLVSYGDGLIKIWDYESARLLKNIFLEANTSGMVGNSSVMAVSPDNRLFAYQYNKSVRVFSLETFTETQRIPLDDNFQCLTFSKDGQQLFGGGNESATYDNFFVKKMEVSTGATSILANYTIKTMATHGISWMKLNAAGDQILVFDGIMGTRIYDVRGVNKLIKSFEKNSFPFAYLPNGNLLAVYGEKEEFMYVEEVDGKSYKSLRRSPKMFTVEYGVDPMLYCDIFLSPAGNHIFQYQNVYVELDPKTLNFNKITEFEHPEFGMVASGNVAISPDGKQYLTGMNMSRFELDSNTLKKRYGYFAGNMTMHFSMKHTPGVWMPTSALYFDRGGLQLKRFKSPVKDASYLYRLTKDGQRGFILVSGGGLYSFDPNAKELAYTKVPGVPDQNWVGLHLYDDLDMMTAVCPEGVYILDLNTPKLRAIVKIPNGGNYVVMERNDRYYTDVSPDKSKLVFLTGTDTEDDIAYCYDLVTKKQLWKFKGPWLANGRFVENGKKVILTQQNKIITLDPATGREIENRLNLATSEWWSYISPSGKLVATSLSNETDDGVGRDISISDIALRQEVVKIMGTGSRTEGLFFLNDERYIIVEEFGQLRIWDLKKVREVASIQIFEDTDDWIVTTPDGHFDASPGAMQKMYYSKGKEIIPLESLYENFYVPNLLNQVWDSDLPAQGTDIKKLKSPPVINLIYKENKERNLEVDDDDAAPRFNSAVEIDHFRIKADSKDDAIAEIRLFQNGKLIQSLPNLNTKSVDQAFDVTLAPGENHFRAVAINQQRTESNPAEIILQYTPAVKKTETGITLHLITVGINSYKNPKYNLNYAEADAKSFAESVGKSCGRIVSNCKQHIIFNEKADKAMILAELNAVVKDAKASDVFVFYYAGHGVVAEDKTFYLVPHDVTQLYGNDGALAQKGISAAELKEFSQQIKAQKQLFILDACQSSGAIQTIASRGAAEEKAIAQLARSTGTHWLTAAGSEQFASEFAQLGHGVFTYALLQGLNGAADTGDGKVTVKELDAYLQEQVPELTRKYKGTPQYPASFGFGNDFPIGIK